MEPVTLSLLAMGTIMRGVGQYQANQAQAQAEEQNASFYREQAAFAKAAGDRSRKIFDRESAVLLGDQVGAFAKAGVDTGSSSFFLAQQMLYRQEESYAIKQEADFNVRLAMLRAEQASSTASALTDPMTNILQFGGSALSAAAQVL